MAGKLRIMENIPTEKPSIMRSISYGIRNTLPGRYWCGAGPEVKSEFFSQKSDRKAVAWVILYLLTSSRKALRIFKHA